MAEEDLDTLISLEWDIRGGKGGVPGAHGQGGEGGRGGDGGAGYFWYARRPRIASQLSDRSLLIGT